MQQAPVVYCKAPSPAPQRVVVLTNCTRGVKWRSSRHTRCYYAMEYRREHAQTSLRKPKENSVFILKYEVLDFLQFFYENHILRESKLTLSSNNKHTLHSYRRRGFSHFSKSTRNYNILQKQCPLPVRNQQAACWSDGDVLWHLPNLVHTAAVPSISDFRETNLV